MPFPWTKNRVTRISQIVADLQSPKRRRSLVVETGFPTSLIDLFVKNRTRFRKRRSKRQVSPEISDPPPPANQPEKPTSTSFTVVCDKAPSATQLVTENVHGDDGAACSDPKVGGSGSKTVLAAFLKLLVVLVLIASVEKLTVGITVSAFVLMFIEYAREHVLLRSKGKLEIVKILTRGIFSCFWLHKLQLKVKKGCEVPEPEGDHEVVSELVVGTECGSDYSSFEEIEVMETKSEIGVCSEETYFADTELDCVNVDNKWGCSEDSNGKVVGSCEVSLCETKGSRSDKFKSKMKKLLPKKFRGSKKEEKERTGNENKDELSNEGSSTASAKEISKSSSFEIKEEQSDEVEDENRSALLLKIKLEHVRENEVGHGVTFSQECSLVKVEEVTMNNEDKRIDGVGNSGYIIMFIIALVGLIVGRFPALILTMTWCFMLKIVNTKGRSKVPLIKCPIPKS